MDKLVMVQEQPLSEAQWDAFEVVRKLVLPQLVNVKRSREGLALVVDVLEYAAAEGRKALGEAGDEVVGRG